MNLNNCDIKDNKFLMTCANCKSQTWLQNPLKFKKSQSTIEIYKWIEIQMNIKWKCTINNESNKIIIV